MAVLVLASPASAGAHGLGGRVDLPIPQWLFGWGATVVLVVSFVALGALWRRPLLQRAPWQPLPPRLGRAVTSRPLEIVCGVVGVGLLVLVVHAGLAGASRVDQNLGRRSSTSRSGSGSFPSVCCDVFALFNPWRAVGRTVARIGGALGAPPSLPYPPWLGRWPAAAGLLCFAWLELVSTRGDRPATVALAVLVYSALTWLGMSLFGVERWTRDAEAFSVYFNLLSRVSIFERRGRQIGTPGVLER